MDEIFEKAEERMSKTLDSLSREYAGIRAGRANPAVLDRITVDYYGTETPINQVSAISVAEARVLVIQPWDKSLLSAVEKAIQASDLGINPQNDGSVLRLIFPTLTEDRRRELAKEIAKRAEEAKVAVRNIRRDGMEALKKLKKLSEITEDDLKDGEERLQEITDAHIKEIDETAAVKDKEIMSI